MKANYWCILIAGLLAGVVLGATGCGEQKQTDPKEKKETRKQQKQKNRLTLEGALKQKFNVVPGWDAAKKRFIAISRISIKDKNKSDYSINLLHDGQLTRPAFSVELQGAILGLGEIAAFIQEKITDKDGILTGQSSVKFGGLKVKVETTANEKTGKFTKRITISREKEHLFLLNEIGEKTSFQHTLAAPDINLFKSLMASNGLEYTLIGWSEENGFARMAYSFKHLDTWKEKMTTASKAKLEYTKKEVRSQVKTGMKKLSKKLDEWSEDPK